MDSEIRSWLIGVPFEADCERPAHARLVLSPHHKRELASFTGLVMATTVFFLAPLLLTPTTQTPDATALVQAEVGAVVATASAPVPVLPSAVDVSAAGAKRGPQSRSYSDATLAGHTTSARGARVDVPNRAAGGSTKQTFRGRRKGFSGALMRVLVGNGRHRVQPFPTPFTGD